ncbi:MAG: glycosyltransferase family 2 protein [Dehalococcoidia bacterium]
MTSRPLVSVIIPVYNGAQYLTEALESVRSQDYEPLEIIVADDGSTDDSAVIAESFPGVRCLRLPKCGVSRARNLAIEQASGEWLAFLDADDIWLPGKLAAQVAAGRDSDGPELILTHQTHRFEIAVPEWFRGPRDGSPSLGFEPSSWLVRRSAFLAVGPFDETRTLGEDTDWYLRAMDSGVRNVHLAESFVIRRVHGQSTTVLNTAHRRALFQALRESAARKSARNREL